MSSVDLGFRGFLLLLAIWLCTKLVAYLLRPAGVPATKLKGPPSPSRILGFSRYAMQTADISVEYEQWAALYGGAFELPLAFGIKQVIISDPKALNHCYNTERAIYVRTESERQIISAMFGRGVLWAEGEMHKRQRKALTPAFSNAAIRKLTGVFYDSAYKLKSFWDESIESSPDADSVIIEVQEWMNRVALDSIGIGGFSHDFQYIEGKESPVTAAFHALELTDTSLLTKMIFAVAILFPALQRIPTERMRTFWRLRKDLAIIAEQLLEHTRHEKENGIAEEHRDKSIIGLLMKAEVTDAELYMTQEEVVAQMNVLLLAGYETTSVSLTWALIELSKHPEVQEKLRDELTKFGGDPTWDQFSSTSDLPYLDAIVLEVLRMHPALKKTPRLASQDDVIPLSTPIVTATGETVSSIAVAKGTVIVEPIRAINRSEALWGPDAKEFNPERWFKEIPVATRELQGYRHLLTFHDGPRTCLGKGFALAEFKAVLSVLVRNYAFEFPRGPDTKIEEHTAIIDRPKVAGEKGAKVPLRVRRL